MQIKGFEFWVNVYKEGITCNVKRFVMADK